MSKVWQTICVAIVVATTAFIWVPSLTNAQTPAQVANKPQVGFTSCDSAWASGDNLGSVITFYICVANRYITVIAVFIIIVVGIMYIIGGFKPDMAGIAKTIFGTTVTGLIFMYLITFIINILAARGIISSS